MATKNKSAKNATTVTEIPEIVTPVETDAVNPSTLADLAGNDEDGDEGDDEQDETESGQMKPLADGEGGTKKATKQGRKKLVDSIPTRIAAVQTQIANLANPEWIETETTRLNAELSDLQIMLKRVEQGLTAKPTKTDPLGAIERLDVGQSAEIRETAETALLHLAKKLGLDVAAVQAMMGAK